MLPEDKPADGDRGALARPPWLTGEKPSRRVRLGRGRDKDQVDDIAADGSNGQPTGSPQRPKTTEPPREAGSRSAQDSEAAPTSQSDMPRRVRVPFDRGMRITQPVEPPAQPPVPETSSTRRAPEPPPQPVAPGPPPPLPPRHTASDEPPPAALQQAAADPPDVLDSADDESFAQSGRDVPPPPMVLPPRPDPEQAPVSGPNHGAPPPLEKPARESDRWGFEPFPEFTSPSWDSAGNSDSVTAQISDAAPPGFEVPTDEAAVPDVDLTARDTFAWPGPESEPTTVHDPQPQPWTEPEQPQAELDPSPEPESPAFELTTLEAVNEHETPETFEWPEPKHEPPAAAEPQPQPWDETEHSGVDQRAIPEIEVNSDSSAFELPTPGPVEESSAPDVEVFEPETFEWPEPKHEPPASEPQPQPWDEADLPAFDLPTPEPATPDQPVPAEVDDIELRAAALLEAVAAKRSQREDAESVDSEPAPPPIEPSPEPEIPSVVALSGDDDALPDIEVADNIELPTEDEATPSILDTPLDLGPVAADHEVVPGIEDPAPTTEDVTEPPATEPNPDTPSARRSAARKLALPPWQMPAAALPAEFEQFGAEGPLTAADDFTFGPEPQPEPRRRHRAPEVPGPPPLPVPPPGWLPPGVAGSHVPPPVPFPPPPWWPPPPPGMPPPPPEQGHAPPAPPAEEAADRAAPEPVLPQPPGWLPPPNAVAPPPNYRPPQAFRVPPPLDDAQLADPRRVAPRAGWRRTVHVATSGHVNLGKSRKERHQEQLLAEIRRPIMGDFRIAVLSIKGGVGKTTTTLGLGSALAMVRHDRVIAVDANPDRGTLAERVADNSTRSTVRDLLSDPHIHRYADVRNHTLMATSRLEVLASEQDPEVSEVFGDTDYRRTVDILRHFYNIILTDCGTGIMHSAMPAILDLAHAIVLVSSPAMDAARSASATLDWLMQHGHSGLVREAHVVLSASRPGSAALKLDKLYEHFETRCRSVHLIPFDPHLGEGADVDFGLLKPATMQAYLELAGAVSEKFARLQAPREQR